MKKAFLFLIGMLMGCNLLAQKQDIDSLFYIFENSRGEAAYRAALAIDETIGREPNFDADSDKDEIKQKVLRTMILYFFGNDDFQHVVLYSEVGIEHYREIGDLFNLAGCYMTLANAYQRLGQFDKAIECYNQSSQIMDEMGGEMAEVNKRYVMNNIAEIHLSMNEFDRAEELYLKCIEMLGDVKADDTASNLDLATYYQNLAEVRLAQAENQHKGDDNSMLAEAVSYAERSYDLSQRYQDMPNKIINRLMSLSKAYFQNDRREEGLNVMEEALRIAKEEGEVFLEASIYVQKGRFESEMQHVAEADANFAKAIIMAEENHYDELLQEALENAYLSARQYDPKKALEYYERSVIMKDSVFNEKQQQLIRDYQVRYDMQAKEHELQMQQEKNKRNELYVIVLAVVAVLLGLIAFTTYRLAMARKRRNRELERLNLTKDRLLSIVSHDVKTPIGAICSILNQMTLHYDSISETDRKANLIMMHTSADALNARIYGLMQWVKGELENGVVNPTEFNLHDLVDEAFKSHETAIGMKSLKILNEVNPQLVVRDDADVVGLVLHNLLSNAVKFSYPEGEIGVKATQEGGRVWVTVEDNGMGINEKKLEKIFNFMTSSAKGTKGETGTGIGLFVCKQLLDRTGGEIRIESVKGQGTTVRFSVGKK